MDFVMAETPPEIQHVPKYLDIDLNARLEGKRLGRAL
jgi:hypothetical protein